MKTHYRGCSLKNTTHIGGDMKVVCVDGSIRSICFHSYISASFGKRNGGAAWSLRLMIGVFSSVSREEVGYHNEWIIVTIACL